MIADTPANRTQFADDLDLIGEELRGDMTIEVPIQKQAIPEGLKVYAMSKGVSIVEVGRIQKNGWHGDACARDRYGVGRGLYGAMAAD